MIDFDLSNELLYLRDGNISIDNEVDLINMDESEIAEYLEQLVVQLGNDPLLVLQENTFDLARSFLKYFDIIVDILIVFRILLRVNI